MSKAKNDCVVFFSLLPSPALDVLFKVRRWTNTQYTKTLTKKGLFWATTIKLHSDKSSQQRKQKNFKIIFFGSFHHFLLHLSKNSSGNFFLLFFCSFHFPGNFGMSNWLLRYASVLLLFFCLYCNFILNVTSSKTSFASEARNTRKSLFKQPHWSLQSSILHTFSSPASGKCSKESLATFSTVSQETASKSPADCLTGQDGFDCWQWKNVLMERKKKIKWALLKPPRKASVYSRGEKEG